MSISPAGVTLWRGCHFSAPSRAAAYVYGGAFAISDDVVGEVQRAISGR